MMLGQILLRILWTRMHVPVHLLWPFQHVLSSLLLQSCHHMEGPKWKVTYQTELFLDKNKDYVVAEHQALLCASKCSFVSGLFPPSPEESSKSSKFSSIDSRFKQQLQSLLETLSSTEPHYIRCIKPNNLLKPTIFENTNVLQQLRCGGVLEAIRISCAGYPTRRTFDEFVDRFGLLSPDVLDGSCDEVIASKRLLEKVGLQGYQRSTMTLKVIIPGVQALVFCLAPLGSRSKPGLMGC